MSHASRRRRRLFFHEVRELARIAGPIVVAQLGGIAMNTTDTIMVGGLGAIALAAAGIATASDRTVTVAARPRLVRNAFTRTLRFDRSR